MAVGTQLSFSDGLLSSRRKISKLSKLLHKLDQIIDWEPLVREI
jgi:transposase, IS5 family